MLVVVLGAALVMIAALAGQGVAGLLTGTGWVWPDSRQLIPTVGGLLSGHPRVAPAWLVYLSVAVVEAVLLVGYGWALGWVWTELGPGRAGRAGHPRAGRRGPGGPAAAGASDHPSGPVRATPPAPPWTWRPASTITSRVGFSE